MASIEPRAWLPHALGILHEAGYREGSARRRVLEVLDGDTCCLSAQEIVERLREGDRAAGTASVYRALELLVRLGLVRRIDVGDGTARYEAASPGGEHHHHLVCERCGRVTEFEDEELERALERLARRLDHAVDAHDVVLRGSCPDCR